MEQAYRERMLHRARAVLAAAGLVAVFIDPTEPTRFVALAYSLLVAYVVWSLALLFLSGRAHAPGSVAVHAVDLGFAAAVSLFTSGPSSPFFLFFVFALLAGAYRWGMRGSMWTAVLAVVALVAESVALAYPGSRLEAEFETNRALIRSSYLVIMGYLLGFLGESERRMREEADALVRVLSRVRSAAGLRATVQSLFEELLAMFEARAVAAVVRDEEAGTTWVWSLAAGEADAVSTRLAAFTGPLVEFRPEGVDDAAFRLGPDLRPQVTEPSGVRIELPALRGGLPAPIPAAGACVLGSAFRPLPNVSPVLLLAVDPARSSGDALRLLARIGREVAPLIENVDLLRRVRSRAGALERSRVARELHDGVLQTLSGLELELGALRKRSGLGPELDDALGRIQDQLHGEALTVRELMEAMRPVDVRPGELLEYLANVVDRFQRASGVRATLVADGGPVRLSGAVCRELVKVVQEALVNVRRHAAATHVVVRVTSSDSGLELVIDDDGHGFGFEGRLEHRTLESSRRGPVVIRERVRHLGGTLTIESAPGRGSRLEVQVPVRGVPA
jgi:signal transduction histidine kinase